MRFGIRTTFAIALRCLQPAWLTLSVPNPSRAQPPAGAKRQRWRERIRAGSAGRDADVPL